MFNRAQSTNGKHLSGHTSMFCANNECLQGILLHYFIQKKVAAEAHRIRVENYKEHVLSETTCRDWFRSFKNNNFDLKDKKCSGAPKTFEDKELDELLELLEEDTCQTLLFSRIVQYILN